MGKIHWSLLSHLFTVNVSKFEKTWKYSDIKERCQTTTDR